MRVPAYLAMAILICAPTLYAQEDEESWGFRDIEPVFRKVLEWLPEKRRQQITSMSLERAVRALERECKSSPWRCPWKKSELRVELRKVFDEMDSRTQKRWMEEKPFVDAERALEAAVAEDTADTPALNVRLKLDEPEVRNPGTSSARIVVRGTMEGVPQDERVRVHVELRFPERDSPALVSKSSMAKGTRFTFEMPLPRRELLRGRYYLGVRLDFSRSRNPDAFKIGEHLLTPSATRIAWVGLDGDKYRNSPDEAPEVLDQDIDIRLLYRCLVKDESQTITRLQEEDPESFPEDAPEARFYGDLDKRSQRIWAELANQKVVPARKLLTTLRERHAEQLEVFDEPSWRAFLDREYYPPVEAMEQFIRTRQRKVLCERYPEFSETFLDPKGILNMLREYAARLSIELYEAHELEAPVEDTRYVRSGFHDYTFVLHQMNKGMNLLRKSRRGITEKEILGMFMRMTSE